MTAYFLQIRRKDNSIRRITRPIRKKPDVGTVLRVMIDGEAVRCKVTAIHLRPLSGVEDIDLLEIG